MKILCILFFVILRAEHFCIQKIVFQLVAGKQSHEQGGQSN